MSNYPSRGPRDYFAKMRARSPEEEHRAATPLELFFDLVFVVAIAQASAVLHHGIAEAHFAEALFNYAGLMFGIWWAWMNFTWFASAYDCGDVPYRLLVFLQLAGALIMSAGAKGFVRGDVTLPVAGYVVMRLAMVTQWLRAAAADSERRTCARRYAAGIAICQVGWVVLLFYPSILWPYGFVVFVIAELLVPVWAERAATTTWHAGHIAERYGLFTIIVLGESVLALSIGIKQSIESADFGPDLAFVIIGGFLTLLAMWWIYFDWPMEGLLTNIKRAFVWGYGHYLVFASAAAVGAGLAVMVDQQLHHAKIGEAVAATAVAVPVAIYLIVVWLLHFPSLKDYGWKISLAPGAAALTLATPLLGLYAPIAIALILIGTIGIKIATSAGGDQ